MTTCLGKSCVFVIMWRLSNFVCPSFPVDVEVRTWVVIVLIPDHWISIYFRTT